MVPTEDPNRVVKEMVGTMQEGNENDCHCKEGQGAKSFLAVLGGFQSGVKKCRRIQVKTSGIEHG